MKSAGLVDRGFWWTALALTIISRVNDFAGL
jgi:hypothetical protein